MIAKCSKCQHEWQAIGKAGICGWCGADGYKLTNDYIEAIPGEAAMNEKLITQEAARALLEAAKKVRDRLISSRTKYHHADRNMIISHTAEIGMDAYVAIGAAIAQCKGGGENE